MKLLCCLLLLPCAALCQPKDTITLHPGQQFLVTEKLSNYTVAYELFSLRDGTEKKVGEIEDHFQIISVHGEKQGLRICKITFGPNTILDSGLCLLTGLKPVYHRSKQSRKRMTIDFLDKQIDGEVIYFTSRGDSSVSINSTSSVALFDSYYEDVIAITMRFEKGLRFKFPEYIYERGGLVWSTGQVVEKITVQTEAGPEEVWKIEFAELDTKGVTVRTTTFLISARDRQIVSRTYKTSNGVILMKKRSVRG
ncbi:MAG TPA: hypothetical protein PLX35_06195 [Cyclobacteriaceae bacterium]|nr:hypothetical protein [Cyclobacteriaceae bacterium]